MPKAIWIIISHDDDDECGPVNASSKTRVRQLQLRYDDTKLGYIQIIVNLHHKIGMRESNPTGQKN